MGTRSFRARFGLQVELRVLEIEHDELNLSRPAAVKKHFYRVSDYSNCSKEDYFSVF